MGAFHDHVYESEDIIGNEDFPYVVIKICGKEDRKMFKFMALDDIIRISDRFFSEYGHDLSNQRMVQITFCPEEIKMEDHEESSAGDDTFVGGDSVIWSLKKENIKVGLISIYFNSISSSRMFVHVLIHELDHVLWVYEGKEFIQNMDYNERPHEKRAYARAAPLAKKLTKELDILYI